MTIAAINKMQSYIASFDDKRDKEIVAVICAWLSYNGRERYSDAKYIIQRVMALQPYRFITSNKKIVCPRSFGLLSAYNLSHLINALRACYTKYDTLESNYRAILVNSRKYKVKFAHDALCVILSTQHSGFPSRESNCTFLRYNLLLYWLVYSLRVWCIPYDIKYLLPCDDKVFSNAKKKGFLARRTPKLNLQNTVLLTNKALEIYKEDFYKLFELLSDE